MGNVDGRQHPRPAKGVALPGGRRQLVVRIDSDVFEEVRQKAADDKVSVSHMLRLLIEWGLEA